MKKTIKVLFSLVVLAGMVSCNNGKNGRQGGLSSNVAERVYVAPGEWDEFYGFMSGGFSGQLAVYGLPSGRMLKVLPVFSQNPENGYGYTEETKPMLNTSFWFCPMG